MAQGNEKEALTLEKVLFTVLDASPKELESLLKARQKSQSGMLSYFYTVGKASVATPISIGGRGSSSKKKA